MSHLDTEENALSSVSIALARNIEKSAASKVLSQQ